jgi:NitT/TauT family transport system permease protein
VAAEIFGVPGLGHRMIRPPRCSRPASWTGIVVGCRLIRTALYGLLDSLFLALQNWLLRWKA